MYKNTVYVINVIYKSPHNAFKSLRIPFQTKEGYNFKRKLLPLNDLNKTDYQTSKIILKCSGALYINLFI